MAKAKLAAEIFRAISDYRTNRYSYEGPSSQDEDPIPCGLSRISCTDFIAIAFLDLEKHNLVSMFSLEPGRIHVVRKPDNVVAMVECVPEAKWMVSYSNRFNKSDPNRVEASLLRPRTDKEEMQDYLNEVAARAMGADIAEGLRSGRSEIDFENDDYSEYLEDDEIAPLSIYQMQEMIKVMQEDLAHEIKRQGDNKDIEEEAPAVPLKTGAAGANNEAGTRGSASDDAKTGEVEQ